jgi:hypothetical protein
MLVIWQIEEDGKRKAYSVGEQVWEVKDLDYCIQGDTDFSFLE